MPSKILPSILMSFCCVLLLAQEPSEILVFDLTENDSLIRLSNPVNISDNPGYDNQPMFTEDGLFILFSSAREGQTDIARYNIEEGYRNWLTNTTASEYSPAPYPGKKKFFSCVRLNEDETQYLYKYAFKNREPQIIIPGLKVGYYLWLKEKMLITFVLGDEETLQVSNFRYKIRYPIAKNTGRSLQKIPMSVNGLEGQLSFISLEHGSPEIYAIDPKNSELTYVGDALPDSQDLVWTLEGSVLMGNEEGIYFFRPGITESWFPVEIETEKSLHGFSRMAVSPNGKKVAVVVSE
jgi:hypothetical protein